jgi:thiosulfate dehydrogenase (quinone) large subunit
MPIVAVLLMLAWRVAGYWGLDRWVLSAIGVPGVPGTLFGRRGSSTDAGQLRVS